MTMDDRPQTMEKSGEIVSFKFEKLEVWQMADRFPENEKFNLKSQITLKSSGLSSTVHRLGISNHTKVIHL